MKTRNGSISTLLPSACLLLVGLAVFTFGLTEVLVAQPSPFACGPDRSGNVCRQGETCIFGFCWEWEEYWPTGDDCPRGGQHSRHCPWD